MDFKTISFMCSHCSDTLNVTAIARSQQKSALGNKTNEANNTIVTRSSAIAERPARRSVSFEMLMNYAYIACQPEEHFQQLPRFIPLPA